LRREPPRSADLAVVNLPLRCHDRVLLYPQQAAAKAGQN
jgi:hypothetical protein